MKKVFIILLVFSFNLCVKGQTSESSSSQEFNENIYSNYNTTRINLFDIDYNGTKIPISLSYSHDGIKVNEKPDKGLGVKWKIDELGVINRTVNCLVDNLSNGWFNSQDPSFLPSTTVTSCNPGRTDCYHFGSFTENDLSPDFFSLNTCNGIHFDFLYKKTFQGGIIGTPSPLFLSNPDGFHINTNFNNFNFTCGESNNNIVFNIIDKLGNNYDFVNGAPLVNYGRGFLGCTTNFYLKTISNPSNSDYVSIDYISKIIQKEIYYPIGLNEWRDTATCVSYSPDYFFCINNNSDYNNDIIQKSAFGTYTKDESRFDIKKIMTNKEIIVFIYSSDFQYLNEISISDFNNKHIISYYFSYEEFQGTTTKTLIKINKDVTLTSQSPIIYSFDYYPGQNIFESYPAINGGEVENGEYADYFGYNNGEEKHFNLLPFPVRNENGILPAANCEPNINFAKQHSLYKIKNKYSGITEFDYQLKAFNDPIMGYLYGGGLQISSKKIIPNNGKSTLINYEYENLTGFVIATNNLTYSYLKKYENGNWKYKFYTSMPKLFNTEDSPYGQIGWYSIQQIGNFFANVKESVYDLSTMTLLSKNQKNYVSNYEGVNKTPLLSNENFENATGVIVKSIDYTYDYQSIETLPAAEYNAETRNDGLWIYKYKAYKPVPINRVNLIKKKETTFNPNPIESITNYTYINPDSKILRSTNQLTSLNETIEEKYFYSQDNETIGDPFRSDLIANNIIGNPLKKETFRNTEKLSEQKVLYAKDASTNNLLEPKYLYAKKGTDLNSTLEKKVTYDSYDNIGNIIQYTQENGVSNSIIWGYNKTQPIAEISNITYASIPANLITAAQNASDINNNEANLLIALNAIRTDSALTGAMITTYTYVPLVGVSTITDPKGDRVSYTYDSYGRIQNVRDRNNNILSEKEYNYKP